MRFHLRSTLRPSVLWLLLILLVNICYLSGPLRAQTAGNSGQIVGQVLDPSAAAVAGAAVTVRNTNTNFTRSTTTDTAGRYAVSLLPLGPYEVTTKSAGFEPAMQKALVTLGSSVTVDFKLTVGTHRETVQVVAGVSTADTTLAPSKSVLTALQLRNIPFNGGRVQNLIWDVPGGQLEPE